MEYWDRFVALVGYVWGLWMVKVLVCHVLVNVAVAIAASIYTKSFVLAKTGEFLYRKALPYALVSAVAYAVGESAGLSWVSTAAWAVLEVSLLGDLADNLILLGIPIPEPVVRFLGLRKEEPFLASVFDDEDERAAELTDAYDAGVEAGAGGGT